jgi:hypothetical protein
LEKQLSLTKTSNFVDNRFLFVVLNISISVALFVFTKLEVSGISNWELSRFLVDIFLSSIVLFYIFHPLTFFLEQFTTKFRALGPSNSSTVK